MIVYQKIRAWVTKYRYVGYGLCLALLLGACFWAQFSYAVAIFASCFSIFLPLAEVFNLYIFTLTFERFYAAAGGHSFILLHYFLMLVFFINHLILAIKTKAKSNYILLVLLLIFTIYTVIPPHVISTDQLIDNVAFLAFLYLVYQERRNLDFVAMVKLLTISLIATMLMGLLKPFSARLQQMCIYDTPVESGYLRQRGIAIIAGASCVLALLCLIRYYHKIDNFTFCVASAVIVFFDIRALTRDSLIVITLIYTIFVILYIIKYKRRAVLPLLFLLCSFAITFLLSLTPLRELFHRVADSVDIENNMNNEANKIPVEGNEGAIVDGEILYDPGRIGIWKMYLKTIIKSPLILLFGKGLGANWIGQVSAHNVILQTIWYHGLIGAGLMLAIALCCVKPKNLRLRNLKAYYPFLIFLIPIAVSLMISVPPFFTNFGIYIFIILSAEFIYQNNLAEKTVTPPVAYKNLL